MKKVILLFLAGVLCSCGTTKLPVRLELSSVNDNPVSGMQFIDDNIAIDWDYVNKSRINFKLKNNSQKNIKLIWEDAAYVDVNGKVDRIMHYGVKYADRNESQPPSIIPSGAILEDAIIPVGVVGNYATYGASGWFEGTMFGFSTDPAIAEKQKLKTFGQNIRILLPIEISGEIFEYLFVFSVKEPVAN